MQSSQEKRTRSVVTPDGTVSEIDYYLLPQWFVVGNGYDCELIDLLKLGEYSSIVRRENCSYDTVPTHKLCYTFEIVRFADCGHRFPSRAGKCVHDSIHKRRIADARDKARNAWA